MTCAERRVCRSAREIGAALLFRVKGELVASCYGREETEQRTSAPCAPRDDAGPGVVAAIVRCRVFFKICQ